MLIWWSSKKKRIEISFNDKIEKNFIKDITKRLFEWTNERWIISLSKEKGNLSIKDNKIKIINKEINEFKETPLYEKIRNSFPDAKLLNIKKNKNKSKDEWFYKNYYSSKRNRSQDKR